MAARPDPFVRAHQDAQKAITTFLPSLAGRNDHPDPTPPPHPLAKVDPRAESIRVMALVKKVEGMSSRVARGLPAEEPKPTPEMMFGNQLDAVHTRAIQEAIARVPEEDRGKFISEAQDSTVKWIGAHNGKVIVHGKVELAHSPESAERLAAKIVNNEVEGHDQRELARASGGEELRGDTAHSGTASGADDTVEVGSGRKNDRPTDAQPSASDGGGSAGVQPQGDSPSAAAIGSIQPGNSDGPPTGGDGAVPSVQPPAVPVPTPQGNPAPEIVPPGDGDQPAQGAPPQVQPQEAAKVGTRKDDGHQITQPKNSIPANQKLALDAAPELHAALSTLTQQVPGTTFDRIRPQKATDRLDQKVEDDNDPDTLSDYLGAQVAADTPQAKDAMIDALKKSFKVIEVDDEFLTGRKDKAQYPSANVQVQLSNGLTAEVQIVPREVQDATEQSHQFYKAGRDAEERGDHDERDRQWEKAGDINQGALAQFKQRNGLGAPSVPGYEVMGSPITIGKHTFLRVKSGGSSGTAEAVDPQDATHPEDVPAGSAAAGSAEGDSAPQGVGREDQRTGTARFSKGDRATLKDGTPITVAYADPHGKFVRARTGDGTNLRVVDVGEIA